MHRVLCTQSLSGNRVHVGAILCSELGHAPFRLPDFNAKVVRDAYSLLMVLWIHDSSANELIVLKWIALSAEVLSNLHKWITFNKASGRL